jgi:hypothetical protein
MVVLVLLVLVALVDPVIQEMLVNQVIQETMVVQETMVSQETLAALVDQETLELPVKTVALR